MLTNLNHKLQRDLQNKVILELDRARLEGVLVLDAVYKAWLKMPIQYQPAFRVESILRRSLKSGAPNAN